MELDTSADQDLVLSIADSWARLLNRLESGLGSLKGISFAEYRLLRAIADSPQGRASRVDLAERVHLSASGVTRALIPLQKLGYVESQRSPRDARLTLALLTAAGEELVADASGIVDDIAESIVGRLPDDTRDTLVSALATLT